MKKLFTLLILLLTFNSCFGQQPSLSLLTKTDSVGITLRWIPENVETWKLGLKNGYRLTRINKGEKNADKGRERVIFASLKPSPPSFWKNSPDTLLNAIGRILYAPPIAGSKEELENTDAFIYFISLLAANTSKDVATHLGLRFTDQSASKGEEYEYSLSIVGSQHVVSASASFEIEFPTGAPEIREVNFIDSTTTITFKSSDYAAYHVYRSDDNGVTYKKRNLAPIVPTYTSNENNIYSVTDSLAILHKYYYYKLVGITPFAEESPASEVVRVLAYYTDLPPPQQTTYVPAKTGEVILSWEYPDSLLINLAGFEVIQTMNLEDTDGIKLNSTLLSVSTRQFTVESTENTSFYRIVAVDVSGRSIPSFPLIVQLDDTIAPAKPTNLAGKISKEGIATISWSPNSEKDLYGYRIYRGNQPDENFALINSTITRDTLYSDTISLSLLDKYVYYRIVPIDYHLNPTSMVDTLRLKRPDLIAPIPPTIVNYLVTDTLVRIQWEPSPSEDVVLYKILRQRLPDTSLAVLKEISVDELNTAWADTTVSEGTSYTYYIEAIDDSENSSGLDCSLPLQTPIPYIRPTVKNFQARFDRSKSSIVFTWETPPTRQISHYTLFRRFGSNDLKPYKRFSQDITSFEDENWDEKTEYGFSIVANFQDQTVSKMFPEITIITPTKRKNK